MSLTLAVMLEAVEQRPRRAAPSARKLTRVAATTGGAAARHGRTGRRPGDQADIAADPGRLVDGAGVSAERPAVVGGQRDVGDHSMVPGWPGARRRCRAGRPVEAGDVDVGRSWCWCRRAGLRVSRPSVTVTVRVAVANLVAGRRHESGDGVLVLDVDPVRAVHCRAGVTDADGDRVGAVRARPSPMRRPGDHRWSRWPAYCMCINVASRSVGLVGRGASRCCGCGRCPRVETGVVVPRLTQP